MKLASSTGDFKFYVPNIYEAVKCFKGTGFKHINLEQTGVIPEFFADDDSYKKLAELWGNAAEEANVKYVVSHAPCLHEPVMAALLDRENEIYQKNLRAICRSIEICHILGIKRIVVHACASMQISENDFLQYNRMFYRDLLPIAEKYGIMLMTENWDNAAYHFSTAEKMRAFIDEFDHPLLAACWDTAHGNIDATARNIGQYENIIALGDKLKGLHISDNLGDCHHHSWPFSGAISFDAIMQGLLDVNYDGFFTFEASYTLLHHSNPPYGKKPWVHNGKEQRLLLDPSLDLKKKAVELLYETGKYILSTYNCLEE